VTDVLPRMEQIAKMLKACRFLFNDEAGLQRCIEERFHRSLVLYQREARLSAAERVDFLIDGDVAVEVKIKGAFVSVAEQLQRYAAISTVTGVLLVTTRRQLLAMPETFHDKPVRAVLLQAA